MCLEYSEDSISCVTACQLENLDHPSNPQPQSGACSPESLGGKSGCFCVEHLPCRKSTKED